MPASDKVKDTIKKQIVPAVEEAIAEATAEAMVGVDLPPGTAIGKGTQRARKVQWDMANVGEIYPDVTFTPEETVPVTFNGVRVQLVSGQEFTGPSVFKGIYDEYRKSKRQGSSNNFASPYGGVSVLPGAGPLPPEIVER